MKKFGNVKVNYLNERPYKDDYKDHSEEFLFNLFEKPQIEIQYKVNEQLTSDKSWAIRYHLHPQRELLLSWYPFKKESSLLEIGAGCGALTGMFCQKVNKVVSNELKVIRGEIIAKRWSNYSNLEVIIGNLEDMKTPEKYDYISVVGVLEYSGRYSGGDDSSSFLSPYINFLTNLKKFLKKDGKILLAIENKLGIKYLAGGREDHNGQLFASIENYPKYEGISTFSKEELTYLFNEAGLEISNFYYPYPDYKMPTIVFSESGLEELNITKSSFLNIVDQSNPRLPLYNEIVFGTTLAKEGILAKFSNSFLVEASI